MFGGALVPDVNRRRQVRERPTEQERGQSPLCTMLGASTVSVVTEEGGDAQKTAVLLAGRARARGAAWEQPSGGVLHIELNPVRAGMVAAPKGYRRSSYRANAQGAADPVVSPHEMCLGLGADEQARQVAYRALFRGLVAEYRWQIMKISVSIHHARPEPPFPERA
jgi:hypothetical protein